QKTKLWSPPTAPLILPDLNRRAGGAPLQYDGGEGGRLYLQTL
ncbi:hypothetical protein A2U01_0048195, partial [Trifolium medium]|nr:hypothetical protein [Trifolium medium]